MNVPRSIFFMEMSQPELRHHLSLPDAVDGKDTLGVSLTFHLSRDFVGTCCSASLGHPLANKKIPLSISSMSSSGFGSLRFSHNFGRRIFQLFNHIASRHF